MPVLCFIIHGIGTQDQDFSDPFQKGVHREIASLISQKQDGTESEKWEKLEATGLVDFEPLYWADIGSAEQNNLYRKVYPDLFATKGRFKKALQFVTQFAPARSLSMNLIGDVFGYLGKFQEPIKRKVFQQVAEKLGKTIETKSSFSIILVGHSLGSVILHDLISGCMRYRYGGFDSLVGHISVFTMGSPLSLFSLVSEIVNPDQFYKWINFFHPRDPIAFPMKSVFPKVLDIELSRISWNPLGLHGVYWNHKTVHQHIAIEIIEHFEKDLVTTSSSILSLSGNAPPEMFQPFHRDAAHAGFSSYFQDFHTIPFAELIPKAKEIDVCVVYGGHWINQNAQYFVQALCNPETIVRVCTLSPESPALAGFSCHFSGMKDDDIKKNIKEGKDNLIKAWEQAQSCTQKTGQLKIYQSLNIINHSFYRFDDVIYFVPRFLTSAKLAAAPIGLAFRDIPGSKNVFSWVKQDFESLLTWKGKCGPDDNEEKPHAKLVFDSGNPSLSDPTSPM